jgi:hypothetical protein
MARNKSVTLLASAARTATVSSAAQTNLLHRGVRVHIDQTAGTASESITPSIEVYDPVAASWTAILTGAAITSATTAHVELKVYPGCVAVANLLLNEPLAFKWRVTMTHADSKSATYSVSADYLI